MHFWLPPPLKFVSPIFVSSRYFSLWIRTTRLRRRKFGFWNNDRHPRQGVILIKLENWTKKVPAHFFESGPYYRLVIFCGFCKNVLTMPTYYDVLYNHRDKKMGMIFIEGNQTICKNFHLIILVWIEAYLNCMNSLQYFFDFIHTFILPACSLINMIVTLIKSQCLNS